MKRLALLASLLLATPALAGEATPLTTYTSVICVGMNACSQATDQNCSVALGADTQFPPHASHILVTKDGVHPLHRIDARVLRMIDREMAKMGLGAKLDPEYVANWNKACNVPAA